MKKTIYLLIIITLSILFLNMKEHKKNETKKDSVVLAIKSEIKTLDPQKSTDSISNNIIQLSFETLVKNDDMMNIIPNLASSYKQIDPLNLVFSLKKGVKFHNGDEMTAEDVKFSLDRARTSPQSAFNFTPIKDVKILDRYTVKVTTDVPFSSLLKQLTLTNASIINKRDFLENQSEFYTPIGTGMFKFKEWKIGENISFETFKEYHSKKPQLKNLIVKFITESNTRMIMLETKEADIVSDLSKLDLDNIKKNHTFNYCEVSTPSLYFLGFDTKNPLLKDKRVRQAIAYTINKKDIMDTVYGTSAIEGSSLISPVIKEFNPNIKRYEQNIPLAKKLLAEAGYPNGFSIDLYVSDDNQRIDSCVILQEQLRKIGILVNIKVFQWATYIKVIENPKQIKPLFFLSWSTPTGDSDRALYPLFHSSQIGTSMNVTSFKNAKLDSILDSARFEMDSNRRKDLYFQAQDILQEELPHYALLYPKQNIAFSSDISGVELKSNGFLDFSNISFVN